MSAGVADMARTNAEFAFWAGQCLYRHVTGDWGEVCEEDKEENALSLEQGFRLLSAYTFTDGTKIWIITESDRSATTILLPQEY